jgi:hypothetical protein
MTAEATQTITQDIPWGQIAPWAFGSVAVLVFGILAVLGKLPGIKAKMGDKELTVDDDESPKARPADIMAIQVFSLLYDGKIDFKNGAWAEQCAYIDDVEEEFFQILRAHGADPWHIDAPWGRLKSILTSAADKNHITQHVINGEVDTLYLFDKTSAFRKKYTLILDRPGSTLPNFTDIKEEMNSLVARTLAEFGRIADLHATKFLEFRERLCETIADPATLKAIKEAV